MPEAVIHGSLEEIRRFAQNVGYSENSAGTRKLVDAIKGFQIVVCGHQLTVAGGDFKYVGRDSSDVDTDRSGVFDADVDKNVGEIVHKLAAGEDLYVTQTGSSAINGTVYYYFQDTKDPQV